MDSFINMFASDRRVDISKKVGHVTECRKVIIVDVFMPEGCGGIWNMLLGSLFGFISFLTKSFLCVQQML